MQGPACQVRSTGPQRADSTSLPLQAPCGTQSRSSTRPILLTPGDYRPCCQPGQLTLGSGLTQGHRVCLSRAVTGWALALMTNAGRPLTWNTQTTSLSGQRPRLLRWPRRLQLQHCGHIYTTGYSLMTAIQIRLGLLYFYLRNLTSLPKPRDLWLGKYQWPTPTNVFKAPAAGLAQKGGEGGRPRQRDPPPKACECPPSNDSGAHMRWCVAALPLGGHGGGSAPPGLIQSHPLL